MSVLEKHEQERYDTTAWNRQKARLKKGASRLIDSYASDVIDQQEFEPKIKRIKARIAQIDEQIEQGNQSLSAQHELFLVINHIEEFTKTINVKLSTTDFITKRDTIRALVKRVEVYKDEVVVIFRIDPAPSHSANSVTETKSDKGDRSMHRCKGRYQSALGNTPLAIRFQNQLKQSHDLRVIDTLRNFRQQYIVTYRIKGNHNTLPTSKAFHNPLALPENIILLKAKHFKP